MYVQKYSLVDQMIVAHKKSLSYLVITMKVLRKIAKNEHTTENCSLSGCSFLCVCANRFFHSETSRTIGISNEFNPLNPELNSICYLLALLGAHHFLHVSRIRVKSLTFRRLMSYIYGAPILDVSTSHTTTQHSR